jgi:hypothetical protein
MAGFLLTAAPNACELAAIAELRQEQYAMQLASARQRERESENAILLEAEEALSSLVKRVWSQMPPDLILQRLQEARRELKAGPTWNRITENVRNEETERIAKTKLRRELAAEKESGR